MPVESANREEELWRKYLAELIKTLRDRTWLARFISILGYCFPGGGINEIAIGRELGSLIDTKDSGTMRINLRISPDYHWSADIP